MRVSTGLSFHDGDSMVQAAGNLCSDSNDPHSIAETERIGVVHQEERDDVGDQQSDDIHTVDEHTEESSVNGLTM